MEDEEGNDDWID